MSPLNASSIRKRLRWIGMRLSLTFTRQGSRHGDLTWGSRRERLQGAQTPKINHARPTFTENKR
jgi:hypothetical protein